MKDKFVEWLSERIKTYQELENKHDDENDHDDILWESMYRDRKEEWENAKSQYLELQKGKGFWDHISDAIDSIF